MELSLIIFGVIFSLTALVLCQAQSLLPELTSESSSPLLHLIFSQLTTKDDSNPGTGLPTETQPQILTSLLKQLAARDPNKQIPIFGPSQNHLSITLDDGSANTVNIEFAPNNDTNEPGWKTIIELLADSLALVIREAERQGYASHFKYAISLGNETPLLSHGEAYSPGLSSKALKSAAGGG